MSEELNAAIASASAEAKEEVETVVETTEEPVVEAKVETSETEVVEEKTEEKVETKTEEEVEEKPEIEATKEEEEFLAAELSAADLKEINDDPKSLKAYKKMQAGLTKAFQGIAGLKKDAATADWIRQNPDAALEEMAKLRGRKLAVAVEKVEEQVKTDETVD